MQLECPYKRVIQNSIFTFTITICVASIQKGPHVAKIKNDIFVDLNRAGHDKSVENFFKIISLNIII